MVRKGIHSRPKKQGRKFIFLRSGLLVKKPEFLIKKSGKKGNVQVVETRTYNPYKKASLSERRKSSVKPGQRVTFVTVAPEKTLGIKHGQKSELRLG